MSARPALIAAVLLAACGARPEPRPPPLPEPPRFGVLPDAALRIVARPAGVATLLDRLDALLVDPSARPDGPLEPVTAAWLRLRARLDEMHADLAPGAPDALAAWGIAPDVPISLSVAAIDGPSLGRGLVGLLRVLTGDPPPGLAGLPPQEAADAALAGLPAAIWHARLELGLTDAGELAHALGRGAARLGWLGHRAGEPPPAWAAELPIPGDGFWIGRDPEAGWLVLARGRGGRAVLDLLAPASDSIAPARLVPLAVRPGEGWRAPVGALALEAVPDALAGLEAGLDAAFGLARATVTGGEDRLEMLAAVAEVAAACTERWYRVSRVAGLVELSVDTVGPTVVGRAAAHLTPGGRRAWASALAPSPVDAEGAPAAAVLSVGRRRFVDEATLDRVPASPTDYLDEMRGCALGHPLLAVLGGLAILPAAAAAGEVPVPTPGGEPLGGPDPESVGVIVLGFERVAGDAVARLGVVTVGPAAEVPADAEPLGSLAALEITPLGPRWTTLGPGLAMGYARRSLAGGREAVLLAFGRDALAALESRVPEAMPAVGDPSFLRAWVEPAAIAEGLAAAGQVGPGLAALAALGRRLAAVRLDGRLGEDRVVYHLALEPVARPAPGLDRGAAAK